MPKNIFFKIGCRFLGEEEMRDCHQKEQCSIFILYSFHLQTKKEQTILVTMGLKDEIHFNTIYIYTYEIYIIYLLDSFYLRVQ